MATHSSDTGGGGPDPATGARGRDKDSLGGLIRRARERRGLTLEEVSRETKIPRRHLDAIEHDNLSALPVGFYLRAEIRVYARAVHLDPDLALRELDRTLQPSSSRAPRGGLPRQTGPKLTVSRQWLLILGGVLVAAVGLALGMGREPGGRATTGLRTPAIGVAGDAAASHEVSAEFTPVRADPSPRPAGSVPDLPTPAAAEEPSAGPPDLAHGDAPARSPERTVNDAITSRSSDASTATSRPPATENAPASEGASKPAASEPPPTPSAPSGEAAVAPGPAGSSKPAAPLPMLLLTTEPAGARVTVNGIGWGTAPIAIRYLSPGDKLVRVSKDGYVTEERVVHLAEGRPVRIDLRLRPVP